jgi:glucose/arabinose dehydrogenase
MRRVVGVFCLLAAALSLVAAAAGGPALGVRGPAGTSVKAAPRTAVELTSVVASGLTQPVYITQPADGSGRLFIVEQPGRIRIFKPGIGLLSTPFLDITGRVIFGGEQGLLSVAFHPNYASNGRLFVNYTSPTGGLHSVIAEYRVSAGNPDIADLAETVLLTVPQPFSNHNGGLNLFGPDGLLYIGLGDGGGAGDPQGNGQRLSVLLGKILRIDVNHGSPYTIPSTNPFTGVPGARGEIWAYGLRNPWRFSFDRATGRMFIGDVGQDSWEEIDLGGPGLNFGWNLAEGAHCYPPGASCSFAGLTLPVTEYDHSQGCAVTGGYVYRGSRVPALAGKYLFGDFCGKEIWALSGNPRSRWTQSLIMQTNLSIASFGEDQSGEVYVVDLSGGVYVLTSPGSRPLQR